MNTWLYLTPQGLANPSTDWPCCLWSATGQRRLMPLNEAAQTLNGQRVTVLLPMELCSWLRCDPWPSKRTPTAQAIAFAVEDQLSEALERLHLSTGGADPQRRYPVMVISRERFAAVLALMDDLAIAVSSVFVDADLLPGETALGIRWWGRWLLGGALSTRLALSDDDLNTLKPGLPVYTQWRDERDSDAVDQWLSTPNPEAINLLQGHFARHGKRQPWHLAGVTALTLMLLAWVASETRIRFLVNETLQLANHNEQRFKALFPEQTRIVDMASQLKALRSHSSEPQSTRIADLVKLVEQVVGASHVDVQRIEFRLGEGWKIQLTANSFAELEQLRERGRQQGMPVRLDSATKQSDRVQATLSQENET